MQINNTLILALEEFSVLKYNKLNKANEGSNTGNSINL